MFRSRNFISSWSLSYALVAGLVCGLGVGHGTALQCRLTMWKVANHSRCCEFLLKVGPSQRVVDLVNVIADVDGACPAVETDRVDVLIRDAVQIARLTHIEDVCLER